MGTAAHVGRVERPVTADATRPRRAYDSPRRRRQAAATRRAVVEVATRLFGEHGFAATGMRDVAREAEVAVETVYASYRSKTELLMAAIDHAVVGGDEPVAMADRTEFRALGEGSRADRIRAAAQLITDVNGRTSGVILALREAAPSDQELARLMREREQGRRDNVEQGIALVTGRAVDARTCDALWAVFDVGAYRLLVDLRGWSPQEYCDWLADAIDRLLD